MAHILDCTTRDGGHQTNWTFSDEYVFDLMQNLINNNVLYYEIGYRNFFDKDDKGPFYYCTSQFLEKFTFQKSNLQMGVMVDVKRYLEDDFTGAQFDNIEFVRVAAHPDEIEQSLRIAKNLYDRGYKVFVQLMDISNVGVDGYISLLKWEYKSILESIYIVDSFGTLQSCDVENYYNKLRTLGYEKISFHGHNTIGKALDNSLRAVEIGAFSIDTTQDGIGRYGGNLNLSDLLNLTTFS